jgi:hypothetical protein
MVTRTRDDQDVDPHSGKLHDALHRVVKARSDCTGP